nr:immunoglobulin light chain junction region [Macaca mulatta]MOW69217.1 immunoglobulin light chain junction region [Macaca mulatta]
DYYCAIWHISVWVF